MALHFTRASNGHIDVSAAGLNFTGDTTFAAIVKKASDSIAESVFGQTASGSTHWRFDVNSGNLLSYRQGDAALDRVAPTLGLLVSEGWALVGVSKATGTTAPRFHKYVYGTGTASHESAASTVADPASPGTTDCRIAGGAGTSLYFDGDIAIAGVWNQVLSDIQFENLAFSLPAWFQLPLKGLWQLDQQATTQKVIDLSGNGGNELSRGGTSIASTSVPVFNYGMPPPRVERQPVAAGGTANAPRDLLLLGAG